MVAMSMGYAVGRELAIVLLEGMFQLRWIVIVRD